MRCCGWTCYFPSRSFQTYWLLASFIFCAVRSTNPTTRIVCTAHFVLETISNLCIGLSNDLNKNKKINFGLDDCNVFIFIRILQIWVGMLAAIILVTASLIYFSNNPFQKGLSEKLRKIRKIYKNGVFVIGLLLAQGKYIVLAYTYRIYRSTLFETIWIMVHYYSSNLLL